MSRYVDLPPESTPVGRCVVLPGRRYTPDGPLLFFATQVALAHGWSVRQVWWDPPEGRDDDTEVAWVGDQLRDAVHGWSDPILVVAKSLGTTAARVAAEAGYDAAWLTPLLREPDLVVPLEHYPAQQFIAIGTEDPFMDEEVLARLPGTHLVVPGDHVLRVPGDPTAMAASHMRFLHAFDEWVAGLRP